MDEEIINSPQFKEPDQFFRKNQETSRNLPIEASHFTNMKSLKAKVQEKDQIIERLTKSQDELMQSLENTKKELREVNKKKDQQVYDLTKQLQESKRAGEEHLATIRSLENEVAALRKSQGSRSQKESLESLKNTNRDLEKKVSNLDYEKKQLLRENQLLEQKLESFEKELKFIEDKYSSMKEEIHKLRQTNSDYENQILEFKQEKVEHLKKLDEYKEAVYEKETEVGNLWNENQHLRNRTYSFRETCKYQDKENYQELENKYFQLQDENQRLKKQIGRKPSSKEIQRASKKLAELEQVIEATQKRGRSVSTGRIRARSNERPPLHGKISDATCRKMVRELMNEYKVKNPNDLAPRIRAVTNVSKEKLFIERIEKLVMDCSPPGAFTKKPSLKRIWKWIRRLVDEYLKIKRQSPNAEVILRLTNALSVEYPDEIIRSIQKILAENEEVYLVLNKLKKLLRLGPAATIPEISEEIQRRL